MKIILEHKPNPTVATMVSALSQSIDRHTMTRGDFYQWFQAQRKANPAQQEAIVFDLNAPISAAYQEKLDLRSQIESEIKAKRDSILHARHTLFKHRDDRMIDDPEPVSGSMVVIPPPVNVTLEQLPDKDTEQTKAAIRKLNSIPERLKERLDAQLAPLMPKLRQLNEA